METLVPNSSLLQTDVWAAFKESQGWHAHKVGGVVVLEKPLPMAKSLLYSPEVRIEPDGLLDLIPAVYKIAQRRGGIFYRLELLVDTQEPLADSWRAALHYTKFRKAFEEIQPEHRQIVPLTTHDDTLMAQMKQKGRYNIRVAEKAEIRVRETTTRTLAMDVDIFYALFQQTATRDKFSIRPKAYFMELSRMLYEHDLGKLFVASYGEEPVAAAIITLYDGCASYLYGASSSHHREKMGPYALHWAVMQWAATRGGKIYDLLAIRPGLAQLAEENTETKTTPKSHPYDGITRFKQQFGGQSVELLGSWDLAFNQIEYSLFTFLEKLRRH